MKTIALDFETANPGPGNACQLGLAWIENMRVTRVESRLIRPHDMHFTFTWVHGITARHVESAPEFPAILAEFHDELDGALVLAHNAGFDSGVMQGCARRYSLRMPPMNFLCTLTLARRVWPDLPSKALNNVAAYLGISFTHHDAAEDARACAQIAIAAAQDIGLADVAQIPDWLAGHTGAGSRAKAGAAV